MMLTPNLTYAAYMVFKLAADDFHGLDYPFQHASVSIGGRYSTYQVCLQGYIEVGKGGVPQKHMSTSSWSRSIPPYCRQVVPPLTDDIVLPWKRDDGWMEVELGEFYNEESYDDEVYVCLMETKGCNYKHGLVVWGIEIRIKQ
jgi:hypothetical protein